MQAKTTPLLFLQDFAFKSNAAVLKTVMSFALLLMVSLHGLAQSNNGQAILDNPLGVFIDQEIDQLGTNPFNRKSANSRSQYLYQNAEFASKSVGQELITHISFYVANIAGSANFTDFRIRMGYTDLNDFRYTNAYMDQFISDPAGMQEYYNGTLSFSGDGWVEIKLDTPFLFDLSLNKNLIVEVAKTGAVVNGALRLKVAVNRADDLNSIYVRGCYGTILTSLSVPGREMYTTQFSGNSGNTTMVPENFAIDRPVTKFRFKGTAANSNGGSYIIGELPLCDSEQVTINIDGVHGSGLSYQWQEEVGSNNSGVFEDLAGETNTYLNVDQFSDDKFYKCTVIIPGEPGVEVGDRATVKAVNTWDGTSWSRDHEPLVGESVIYKSDGDITENANFCNIKVIDGANVTVAAGKTLTIEKGIAVEELANIVFENNSSLIQLSNTAVNVGKITYKRTTPILNRYDYTYYSSPVNGAVLNLVSPNTLPDKYFSFVNNNWFQHLPTDIMKAGVGYIIRAPQTYAINGSTQTFDAEFFGEPNNGDKEVDINSVPGSFNLIGNPYPSAVDANKFVETNGQALDGAIYFWQHVSGPSTTPDANGIYNYTSDDNYVTVTLAGSTSGIHDYKVAAGQSFMVKTLNSGYSKVRWENKDRIGTQDNVLFYKNSNNVPVAHHIDTAPAGRVWLEINGLNGKYQKMLLAYVQGATDGYDNKFDAEHMQASALGFYAIAAQNKEYGIMAKGLPFNEEDIVPIGYSTTSAGNLTINKFLHDGFFSDFEIFLNDKLANTSHNLSESGYTFASGIGTFNDRFIIAFKRKTVSVLDATIKPLSVIVSDKQQELRLTSKREEIRNIEIYDISGRLLQKITNCKSNDVVLANLVKSNRLLIIRIELVDNDIEIQKYKF